MADPIAPAAAVAAAAAAVPPAPITAADTVADSTYRAMRSAGRNSVAAQGASMFVRNAFDEARDAHFHQTVKKDIAAKKDIKRLVAQCEEAATRATGYATQAQQDLDNALKHDQALINDAAAAQLIQLRTNAGAAKESASEAQRWLIGIKQRFVR